MADQHNSNIPAMGNQIANDIPDIKENLEYHKDAFQRLFSTWDDTTITNNVFGPTNGSYTFGLPTNGVSANGVFMTGDTNTILWMYLNSAPPGWKVLATGADTVLAVAGGTAAYNVLGGNPDSVASWSITGLTADSHTHSDGTLQANADASPLAATGAGSDAGADDHTHGISGDTGTASADGVTSDGTYRVKGSVGKLFQLDTA